MHLKPGDEIVHPGEIYVKSHFTELIRTNESLTRKEAHKTNPVHEE